MTETYFVLYYTAAGTRRKDFTNEKDARDFYDKNVKKHPEYQTRSWSQTDLYRQTRDEYSTYVTCLEE